MSVIDRRKGLDDWHPPTGSAQTQTVSSDPEAWSGVDLSVTPDTPYTVAWTDVAKVDSDIPAPEERPAVDDDDGEAT